MIRLNLLAAGFKYNGENVYVKKDENTTVTITLDVPCMVKGSKNEFDIEAIKYEVNTPDSPKVTGEICANMYPNFESAVYDSICYINAIFDNNNNRK